MASETQTLAAQIRYSWKPFCVSGRHLSFAEHLSARLERSLCTWWGPAIYKWEGTITSGPKAGKCGVLIGETADLRQRIKQYVSGTQERGNKLWRETFLALGTIALYTLQLESFVIDGRPAISPNDALASNNIRLVLEQLLVMEVVAQAGASGAVWVVNARQ